MMEDERREDRPFAPYLFFIVELIVIAELSYMYTFILGDELIPLIFHVSIFIYLVTNSLRRMIKVINRAKFNKIDLKKRDSHDD